MASSSSHSELARISRRKYTPFPIPPENMDMFLFYKKQDSIQWPAEDIDFSKDKLDYPSLTDRERRFYKKFIAFFAPSDGLITEQAMNFLKGAQYAEEKMFLIAQLNNEQVHCVSGDTRILTDAGYYPIASLLNQTVRVWNGKQFSETVVRFTGQQELYRVTLNNGMFLDCTSDHKWFVTTGGNYAKKSVTFTKDLTVAMDTIYRCEEFPVLENIPNPVALSNAYTLGATDDTMVPVNATSVRDKLTWLEGLCDSRWLAEEIADASGVRIQSENITFLRNVQLLLTTLNVQVEITALEDPFLYELTLTPYSIAKLASLGFAFRWKAAAAKNYELVLYVTKIEKLGEGAEKHDTYCFNEPLEHAGVFNGILTGQSETYARAITDVMPESEWETVFSEIDSIECVKAKALFVEKWIDNTEAPRGLRYLAGSFAEGIFFMSLFAMVFFFRRKNKFSGFCSANEFILRDETLHRNFNAHMAKRLGGFDEATAHTLAREAVEIELAHMRHIMEEPVDSLEADASAGLTTDNLTGFVKTLADQVLFYAGVAPVFKVAVDLPWMRDIGLTTKQNFYETLVTKYSKISVKGAMQDAAKKNETKFGTGGGGGPASEVVVGGKKDDEANGMTNPNDVSF